jgi:hypothetical protein
MMARRLQEELNGGTGGRSTRNGGATAKKTKSRKKKSKSTVSDGESGEDGKPKKKRKVSNTGFNKPHLLSPEMSEVCGKQVLSRPGVTKVSLLSPLFSIDTEGYVLTVIVLSGDVGLHQSEQLARSEQEDRHPP